MMEYIDPNIKRKKKILKKHISKKSKINDVVPSFSLIEFNITELCNRKCEFCPRVDPKIYPNRNEFMSVSLYEKIMKDLAEINYSGRILFSAFSEPLLHRDIEEMIGLSKRYCAGSSIELVSNGDTVHIDVLLSLFKAGLDVILISMYDGPEQKEHFHKLRMKAGLSEKQMLLRERYLGVNQNYGLTISNRAGAVDVKGLDTSTPVEGIHSKCFYPFYQMMVDYDGAVLLCPHDWTKKVKAGSLRESSVLEIWNSRVLNFLRKRLARADRNFLPCVNCNVNGTLMGKEHFDLWEKTGYLNLKM